MVTAEEILQKNVYGSGSYLRETEMLNRAESRMWKRVTAFMENVGKTHER